MNFRSLFVLCALVASACTEQPPTQDRGASVDRGPIINDTSADKGSPDLGAPDTDTGQDTSTIAPSPGCGLAAEHALGGVQLTHTFSASAGGERSFYLVIPTGYRADQPHRVIVAYAGTDWLGEQIRGYFKFESGASADEIFVYPDVRWHDFKGWGNMGGWLLGPHAHPAQGTEDIEFTRELLDYLAARYCVDPERIFATGHSWGGDMAAVVACFLGDRFRASAPAAANRPYWFEPTSGSVGCTGGAAVWTFFGQDDTYFSSSQDYPGQFGEQQMSFWTTKHGCAETSNDLLIHQPGECVEYDGCAQATRYCFYDPAAGHGIPGYFSAEVLAWFRSF